MKTKTKTNGAPASPTNNPNPQPEEQAQQPAAIDNDVDSGGDGPYDLFDPEFDEPAETTPRSRFLDPEAQAHVDRAFPERPRTAAVPVAVPVEKAPKGGFWAGVKGFFKGAWWLIEFVLALGASWGLGSLFAMAFTPTVMDFLYSTGHMGFWAYHWAKFGLWFNHYSPTYATAFLATHLIFTGSIFFLALFTGRGK